MHLMCVFFSLVLIFLRGQQGANRHPQRRGDAMQRIEPGGLLVILPSADAGSGVVARVADGVGQGELGQVCLGSRGADICAKGDGLLARRGLAGMALGRFAFHWVFSRLRGVAGFVKRGINLHC